MTMLFMVTLWALCAHWIAYTRGFYQLKSPPAKTLPSITLLQLFAVFGSYLGISFFVAPLCAKALLAMNHSPSLSLPLLTGLQLAIMVTLLVLVTSIISNKNPKGHALIWKNKHHVADFPSSFDFALGVLTWVLSFPLVTVIGELIDSLIKIIAPFTDYQQAAVLFVKQAMSSPVSLMFAVLSVLILAPLIEEFLFRGVLQTYFKRVLGFKAALLVSSFCFALFHFTWGQGLGNISLLVSLFILGLYLGFLYERQASLWAPIGLHVTFNTISALRIIFFTEGVL